MTDHPFGLGEPAFADGHDPRFIYPAEQRVEAVALLRRRIAEGESFVVVTGDPGCGKTSVVAETLEAAGLDAKVAVIAHPSLSAAELVEAVCIEFGAPLPNPPSKPQALAALERRLRELRDQGTAAVLVLDEAHGLKSELLEEVRLLSNMKAEGRGLLQTMLVGLPELERRLGLPELAQLRQRVGFHCRLAPLDDTETACYLWHRVDAAGGDGAALFPEATCREIHNYTNGVPRDLNTLAGRALEHAAAAGAPEVSVEHVRVAAGDARPRGIATATRAPAGAQPFELRRRATPGRASAPPPRPAAPAPVAPPPPPPAPPPPAEVRRPPSFLREQASARAPDAVPAPSPRGGAEPSTLEDRFRNGELVRDEPAPVAAGSGGPGRAPAWMPGSENAQELGASVLLVGLLVVVLMATGQWHPVAPEREPSMSEAAGPVDPEPESGAPAGAVVSEPARATLDPETPPPPARGRAPVARPAEPADPAEPAGNAAVEGRPAYGFEVAAYAQPESADATLRRISRGTKLPVRVVTKRTGHPYRVVVGPFPRRRDAEKAIHELFRRALVERARLVQISE